MVANILGYRVGLSLNRLDVEVLLRVVRFIGGSLLEILRGRRNDCFDFLFLNDLLLCAFLRGERTTAVRVITVLEFVREHKIIQVFVQLARLLKLVGELPF